MSNPDFESQIRNRIHTKCVGRILYCYPELATTMQTARVLANKGAAEGTVVIAGTQTAGKGRIGRTWLSPEGSLAMSVILKPQLKNLPQLIMIASLAVVRATKHVAGIKASIKWPNDVLINGKKVCGILIENEVATGTVHYANIGIGINANFNPTTVPEIADIATSLSSEAGQEVSLVDLAAAVIDELELLYLDAQHGAPVFEEWKQNLETLGKRVKVDTGKRIEQGKAESVTENGNLLLRADDGSLIEIVAGDVTVLKN